MGQTKRSCDYNSTKPSCDDVITACDKALADKNAALGLADLAIKKCEDTNGVVEADLQNHIDSESKFYHNPFIMGLLGILGGIVVSKTLLK